MTAIEIIRKKRDGVALAPEEIKFIVNNFTSGKIPDYQFAAFLMAVYLKGMTKGETSALTNTMLYSGKVIDLSSIPGFKVDKHSTGGVGDKTSLILAPLVALAGLNVPMISGRALGHTGGTLDKLESIPGFNVNLNLTQYKSVIKKHGCVMIGQTPDIAPADKVIYALRDVTSTVESIPLITASIMSKKLAEGIDGLVLDVKTGSGAFMKKYEDAKALADSMFNTAVSFNKKVAVLITSMNQPLGTHIGNLLEVKESVEVLSGADVPDLNYVTFMLAGAMLYLGGKAGSIEEGAEMIKNLTGKRAVEKFAAMVKAQGGDPNYITDLRNHPKAKYRVEVKAGESGYIKAIDTFSIGIASNSLGAGRLTKEDKVDPLAGIVFYPKIGDYVTSGQVIAVLHTNNKKSIKSAEETVLSSFSFSTKKQKKDKLLVEVIQ
ncbi:MAG: thymidine phosphorylase [Ignavibacteriaceae bacterium]|nr:thymidine phosphorylase [Ignavibacteriaceae bacterium]